MHEKNNQAPGENIRAVIRSWSIVALIAATFLVWGLFLFFSVGDKGPPDWDYSIVRDIPGESPFSTHRVRKFVPGKTPPRLPEDRVNGQHVAGSEHESNVPNARETGAP
jgi:hypothetical protein